MFSLISKNIVFPPVCAPFSSPEGALLAIRLGLGGERYVRAGGKTCSEKL